MLLSRAQDASGAPVTTGYQNTSRFVDMPGYEDRIQLRYTAGIWGPSVVTLVCDEKEPNGKFVVLTDHMTSEYQFALYTAYACPVHALPYEHTMNNEHKVLVQLLSTTEPEG